MRTLRTPRSLSKLLRSFALLPLIAFCLGAPVFATATSTPAELGSDGTIYRLWSGTFAEVFGPDNNALPGDMPVLALDIVPPGQPLLRYLVPGTEGVSIESSAALLFDRSSSSVHLVWNSRTFGNLTISRLNLRSFTPAGWSDLIELSGGTLTDKSGLRLAQTSDDYATSVDGSETRIPRRVLHLVWSENVAGVPHSYYSPIVFLHGRYLGWNPVVALDDLAANEPVSAVSVPVALRAAPSLATTAAGRVSVSFVHSQTNRLVAVDVQTLAGELGELAEMARGHIVELATVLGSSDRAELAAMARGHIVELAGRFHPSAAAYIGDRTAELVASADVSIDGATLGEMARGHIVELGREILATGLANRCAGEEVLLEIPPLDPLPPSDGMTFSHFLTLHKVASWELPGDLVTVGAGARILVSADGSRATLAWSGENHLLYRETEATGSWSAVRDLDLGQITLADAWDAIARRASGL